MMLAASLISGSFHPWPARSTTVRAPAELRFRRRSGNDDIEVPGGELSGSDVLRALQRASVEKAKKQRNRESKASRTTTGSEQKQEGEASDTGKRHRLKQQASPAQAPRLKTDWRFRLEELEEKLRQIMLLDQP